MEAKKTKAWREPMVWLVFGLPALVVVAGISTLVIAIKYRDGGEVTDQVQRTAQIQQTDYSPDARAGEMGLRVLLREQSTQFDVEPLDSGGAAVLTTWVVQYRRPPTLQ